MDWISFLWGVGAIIFVNIIYIILIVPKQVKQRAEIEKRYSAIDSKYDSFLSGYEEEMRSLNKDRDELALALERLESSLKLRTSCPICGAELPRYIREEK